MRAIAPVKISSAVVGICRREGVGKLDLLDLPHCIAPLGGCDGDDGAYVLVNMFVSLIAWRRSDMPACELASDIL